MRVQEAREPLSVVRLPFLIRVLDAEVRDRLEALGHLEEPVVAERARRRRFLRRLRPRSRPIGYVGHGEPLLFRSVRELSGPS